MQETKIRRLSDTSVFFQTLAGFAIAALLMLGVGGAVYMLVAPGGWLAQLFGRNLAGGMAAVLALVMIGFCAWLTRRWISEKHRNRYSELFVYAFAAAGALYVIDLLLKGGL